MITNPSFIPAEAMETTTSPKELSTLLTSTIPKSETVNDVKKGLGLSG